MSEVQLTMFGNSSSNAVFFSPALHVSPPQPIGCSQPLPSCMSSPVRRDQGATHLLGEDQVCQRGNDPHVTIISTQLFMCGSKINFFGTTANSELI